MEMAEPDPIRETRPTRSDLNLTRSDFLRKSNGFDPTRTRPDPTRNQMVFNPIEIYQQTQQTDPTRPDPDPTRLDPISSKRSN
jgi:hypothetical protein